MMLTPKSKERLAEVHKDLQKVIEAAAVKPPYNFQITCGKRTIEEQRLLVKLGKSKTLNSRHLTGDAVDVVVYVDGAITWEYKYYKELSEHIKAVARGLKIGLEWGGDWKSFIDAVHYQLPREGN